MLYILISIFTHCILQISNLKMKMYVLPLLMTINTAKYMLIYCMMSDYMLKQIVVFLLLCIIYWVFKINYKLHQTCLLLNSIFIPPPPIIEVPCWNEPLCFIYFFQWTSVNYVKLPYEGCSINSLKYYKNTQVHYTPFLWKQNSTK